MLNREKRQTQQFREQRILGISAGKKMAEQSIDYQKKLVINLYQSTDEFITSLFQRCKVCGNRGSSVSMHCLEAAVPC